MEQGWQIFNKVGTFGYNYFWATIDSNQTPRKLSENGSPITDYDTGSFQNHTIPYPDSTFALPSYCNIDSPSNCPLQSICGQFRGQSLKKE